MSRPLGCSSRYAGAKDSQLRLTIIVKSDFALPPTDFYTFFFKIPLCCHAKGFHFRLSHQIWPNGTLDDKKAVTYVYGI